MSKPRGINFTYHELEFIALAWKHVSQYSIHGAYQHADVFWNNLLEILMILSPMPIMQNTYHEWGVQSIKINFLRKISQDIQKFMQSL